MSRLSRPGRSRGERGAAAVETALCLSVLVLPLIFASIAYGYMFSYRQALSQAATEGARAAVGTVPATGRPAALAAVSSSLQIYGLTCAGGNLVRGTTDVGDCAASYSPSDSACAAVTAATSTTGATALNRCRVTVRVTHDYRDHSLLPTVPGLGFTLPEQLSFTSVVETS